MAKKLRFSTSTWLFFHLLALPPPICVPARKHTSSPCDDSLPPRTPHSHAVYLSSLRFSCI